MNCPSLYTIAIKSYFNKQIKRNCENSRKNGQSKFEPNPTVIKVSRNTNKFLMF